MPFEPGYLLRLRAVDYSKIVEKFGLMGPIKVRIRGIYSTALSRHLLDEGFHLVQASDVTASRLGIEVVKEPPDVTVKDSDRVPGSLIVMGWCDAVSAIEDSLSRLGPVVKARSIAPLHSVYIGKAVQRGDEVLIDLGGGIYGKVKGRYVLTPGSKYVVSVTGTQFHGNIVDVTPDVWLDGTHISLIPHPRVLISRHIRDVETIARLAALGNKILEKSGGYGVKFRSSAKYADENTLEREYEALLSKLRDVAEALKNADDPIEIVKGQCLTLISPTRACKLKLDYIRSRVVPTLTGHHMIKSVIRNSPLLNLLDEISPRCGVDENSVLKGLLPQRGDEVKLVHVKPWGEVYVLGKGTVTSRYDDEIVVERKIAGKGLYDGLNVPKEAGDVALTCIGLYRKYIVHTYYNKYGQEKGTYININTEVEIVGRIVKYIDLLVDVVVKNGETRVVDVEELDIVSKYYDANEVTSIANHVIERPKTCTYSGLSHVQSYRPSPHSQST